MCRWAKMNWNNWNWNGNGHLRSTFTEQQRNTVCIWKKKKIKIRRKDENPNGKWIRKALSLEVPIRRNRILCRHTVFVYWNKMYTTWLSALTFSINFIFYFFHRLSRNPWCCWISVMTFMCCTESNESIEWVVKRIKLRNKKKKTVIFIFCKQMMKHFRKNPRKNVRSAPFSYHPK